MKVTIERIAKFGADLKKETYFSIEFEPFYGRKTSKNAHFWSLFKPKMTKNEHFLTFFHHKMAQTQ